MNYKIYTSEYGKDILQRIGKASNKAELRSIILSHKLLPFISKVSYGKRIYTINNIYAGR